MLLVKIVRNVSKEIAWSAGKTRLLKDMRVFVLWGIKREEVEFVIVVLRDILRGIISVYSVLFRVILVRMKKCALLA
jgi:hypothetical protein